MEAIITVREESDIYKAICELKEHIKQSGEAQKANKKAFRNSMREWNLKFSHLDYSKKPASPYFSDKSENITFSLIVYGKLRGKPHLSNEGMEKYFNQKYISEWEARRKKERYNAYVRSFSETYPSTIGMIGDPI